MFKYKSTKNDCPCSSVVLEHFSRKEGVMSSILIWGFFFFVVFFFHFNYKIKAANTLFMLLHFYIFGFWLGSILKFKKRRKAKKSPRKFFHKKSPR